MHALENKKVKFFLEKCLHYFRIVNIITEECCGNYILFCERMLRRLHSFFLLYAKKNPANNYCLANTQFIKRLI